MRVIEYYEIDKSSLGTDCTREGDFVLIVGLDAVCRYAGSIEEGRIENRADADYFCWSGWSEATKFRKISRLLGTLVMDEGTKEETHWTRVMRSNPDANVA